MAASIPWIWIIVYSVMDGCIHTAYISCIWDISCNSSHSFSNNGVFSWTHSCKAFHPPLSLRPHALGGICYTTICHHPTHWMAYSVTCEHWHELKTLLWHPPGHGHSFPWRQFLVKNPKNSLFGLGVTTHCHTHANGGNPPNRACQLAHCLSVVSAPAL